MGDVDRSLSLNVPLSAPALGGASSPPFVLGEDGVVGRAGVNGVDGDAGEPGAGDWTTS